VETLKIITFQVRGKTLAMPSANVREITDAAKHLKPIFYDRGGALKGVMNYEGEMISVMDLTGIFEMNEPGAEPFILVCEEENSVVGVAISAVVGMETVETANLKHSQDEEANYTIGYLKETVRGAERVVSILDLKKFLAYVEKRIIKGQV
jgi:chemotaxis signal transduction protein